LAIIFLRHAKVQRCFQKRFLGWSDVDIDKSLFEFQKVEVLKKREFNYVFASNLKRTWQTLELLDKDFLVDERVNEVKFKDEIELKSFDEISQFDTFKSSYLDSLESWHRFVAKESLEEFRSRIESFLNSLDRSKEILVCTHAGVLREIFKREFDYLEWDELS